MTKNNSKTVKNAKASKKAAKVAKVERNVVRATVLGYSVTSVAKALGAKGWETEKAVAAINKLAKGGKPSLSTIQTGMSDGKNAEYKAGAAKLSKDELAKLSKAAG